MIGAIVVIVVVGFFALGAIAKTINKTAAKSKGLNKCEACGRRLRWVPKTAAYALTCAGCGHTRGKA